MKTHREFSQVAAFWNTVITKTYNLGIPLNKDNLWVWFNNLSCCHRTLWTGTGLPGVSFWGCYCSSTDVPPSVPTSGWTAGVSVPSLGCSFSSRSVLSCSWYIIYYYGLEQVWNYSGNIQGKAGFKKRTQFCRHLKCVPWISLRRKMLSLEGSVILFQKSDVKSKIRSKREVQLWKAWKFLITYLPCPAHKERNMKFDFIDLFFFFLEISSFCKMSLSVLIIECSIIKQLFGTVNVSKGLYHWAVGLVHINRPPAGCFQWSQHSHVVWGRYTKQAVLGISFHFPLHTIKNLSLCRHTPYLVTSYTPQTGY